jgi:hypothetical protein
MTRWEYMAPPAYVIEDSDLEELLNEYGMYGWELVCWTDRPIFKRPDTDRGEE